MAMNTKSGTDAAVKIETTTVAAIASWSFTDEREALKAPVFGDSFNKVHGMGTRNVSGSMSGFLATGDITGQDVLVTAYAAGTTVSGFRLYIDDTIYFHADGTDANDGVYVTSYNISAEQNGIIPVEFSFEVGGDWSETA